MPPPFSLKQKLSNIALSSSIPSSSPSSPGTPRRSRFTFGRRGNHEVATLIVDNPHENDRLEEIMRKIISQAGLDFETRPIVVITASQFPDPKELSYDLLLHRMLQYLDLFVESDYTVVFLAAGGRYAPPWNWVWKAYRSLSRKYRKNLKKLFIVHTTTFSKVLFSLAGAVISPKFFRKIQYIPTLSALAMHVPLTNLDLDPAVYEENLKHERQITIPSMHLEKSHAFGVSLEELMGDYGESSGIPRVVKDAVAYIQSSGMEAEGLFRRSPNSALLRQVKEAYNRGQTISLALFHDPNIAAVLLKSFFRDLPDPVFPESLYYLIQRCPPPTRDPADRSSVDYIRDTILPAVERISPATVIVLSYVLHLLHDVSLRASINKMDAHNLALCFSPNLVSSSSVVRDIQMCTIPNGPALPSELRAPANSSHVPGSGDNSATLGLIIKICIAQYFEIFEELADRTVALTSGPSLSSSLPSSAVHTLSDTPHSRPPQSNAIDSDDDDDLDGSMLVMPIGPSASGSSPPPSAWSSPTRNGSGLSNGLIGLGHPSTSRSPLVGAQTHQRNDSAPSGLSASASSNSAISNTSSHPNDVSPGTGRYSSIRAPSTMGGGGTARLKTVRSTISIEKAGEGTSVRSGYGNITIGRRIRQTSGAGVEAHGITVEGFFSPASSPKSAESAELEDTGTPE